MALVLGQTSSKVSLIFVVAVDIIFADVTVVDDNIVEFAVVVDVVDIVDVVVVEWEYQEIVVVVEQKSWWLLVGKWAFWFG